MTPDQMKASRELLKWSRLQLALRSGTSRHLITVFEQTGRVTPQLNRQSPADALAAIRATLKAAGAEFTNGEALEGASAEPPPITPNQVKAARKLLGWSRVKLGFLSNTSIHTVRIFERSGRVISLYSYGRTEQVDAVAAIRVTLEAAGVEFTGGHVPGARLQKPDP